MVRRGPDSKRVGLSSSGTSSSTVQRALSGQGTGQLRRLSGGKCGVRVQRGRKKLPAAEVSLLQLLLLDQEGDCIVLTDSMLE